MSQPTQSTETPIKFDEVFLAMKHWKENKSEYPGPGIPDKIWLMLFQLENNGYTASDLKRLFSLNSNQFKIKRNQLHQALDHSNSPTKPNAPQSKAENNVAVDFCEAVVKSDNPQNIPPLTQAADNTKKAISKLKSTNHKTENYLDITTIIVECIRPDGQRLKIHTTNQSLNIVMKEFYQQGVSPA